MALRLKFILVPFIYDYGINFEEAIYLLNRIESKMLIKNYYWILADFIVERRKRKKSDRKV